MRISKHINIPWFRGYIEDTRGGISLRFWRKATHGNSSLEFSLSKNIRFLPSLYVYETDEDEDGPGSAKGDALLWPHGETRRRISIGLLKN